MTDEMYLDAMEQYGDEFDARGRWQSVEQKVRAEKRLTQQLAVLRWWAQSLKAGRRRPEFAAVS